MKEADAATVVKSDLPVYANRQSWYGPDMQKKGGWIHHFSPQELNEIDDCVHRADATGKDILAFTKDELVLPSLEKRLNTVREELLNGTGFFVFKGIAVDRYTIKQAALAYWAIGLQLGVPVSQNGKGHVLGHVANLGVNYADPEVRGYQTSARLGYHTDSSDLVGLLCLHTAKSGGLSSIVSSTTLWNELVKRRPDHARLLMQAFNRTRWGEIPGNMQAWGANPIFAPLDDRVISSYVRSAIKKAQDMPEVPRLAPEQIEALDHLDALAADPTIHLDMVLEPGDIQLVSNHSIFHSRTAYEDWPELDRRRHLLRLWLACDDGPALPAAMFGRLGLTDRGRPNGICVSGVEFVAELNPN